MPKILNINLGGMGTKFLLLAQARNILEELQQYVDICLIDTNSNQFNNISSTIQTISANAKGGKGIYDEGLKKMQKIADEVAQIISNYDIGIVNTAWGGATGSSGSEIILDEFKKQNKQVFFTANTLRFYERKKQNPVLNYRYVKYIMDNNAPYTLISSKAIERYLKQNGLGSELYEEKYSDIAFKFIKNLSSTFKNSLIDLSDFEAQVFKPGKVHFGISTNPDNEKATEEIMDDTWFAHSIDYMDSYNLIKSNKSQRQFEHTVERLEEETTVEKTKIDDVDFGHPLLILFAHIGHDQTLTENDQSMTRNDQKIWSEKMRLGSENITLTNRLLDNDQSMTRNDQKNLGHDQTLTENDQIKKLDAHLYLTQVFLEFDNDGFLRSEASRGKKLKWLEENELEIRKKLSIVPALKPITDGSLRRWLEKPIDSE